MTPYNGPQFVEPDADNDRHDEGGRTIEIRNEGIHIRNYDFRHGYDLYLAVEAESGEPVLDTRYFLQPGAVRSLDSRLDRGRYQVTVRLDDGSPHQIQCRVDEQPNSGILIELGNGQVSVTDGIYV